MAKQARIRAGKLHLPLVNAGDVHGLGFVNRFWIETARPVEKADDVRAIVVERAYQNHSRGEE